ncbi:DUF1439 domain-containing protein [Shewanella marisflavi]|uniref:DUF1439 domain-containing protein n=1 Tax=Shewanella marisflavi TaxID=260364 RepID=A0AAC9XM84_9GAMM|nr:DUF1439 domain-containing protein [Shewanella marisflavi]ASJ95274.1 hypothetical protein CFF01_01005 [Shewanella marisflavi]
MKQLTLLGLMMLLLTACVSQYSISERQLTNYLNEEMHFEVKEGNRFFGIEMKINDVKVKLGHKADTMAIAANSQIKVANPLMPINATTTAEFEAKPWYDTNQHSLYLRELKLVKLTSSPKDLEQAMGQAAPQVMRFITHFLETQPVYVLDTQEGNQALLAEMTKRIEVVPGKINLIFKD